MDSERSWMLHSSSFALCTNAQCYMPCFGLALCCRYYQIILLCTMKAKNKTIYISLFITLWFSLPVTYRFIVSNLTINSTVCFSLLLRPRQHIYFIVSSRQTQQCYYCKWSSILEVNKQGQRKKTSFIPETSVLLSSWVCHESWLCHHFALRKYMWLKTLVIMSPHAVRLQESLV